ncbi:alpha/beta fold hydrolase [Scytonema sp. NUACC26]|uniref:alpha/beta fold hydrolase n=1 Tax=Scytonema sp. NUACC26 TaxID=3140176 RepID=UPI0034DB8501
MYQFVTPKSRIPLQNFLNQEGTEIYYESIGTGPGLIFAHGLSGNYLSWWQQVSYFCDRYNCVTFAHRGFYPSKEISSEPEPTTFVDDLAALIEHLKFDDVFLVAQSMGGFACLEYGLREPSRVRALVMAATTGTVDLNSIHHQKMENWVTWTQQMNEVRANLTMQGIHIAAGARLAHEQPALHFLYREIENISIGIDRAALLAKLQQMCCLPATTLAQLRVPTLFIVGEEDVVSFPGASAALSTIVPNAKFECVPNAGHSVYFERPQTFNHLIDSFFTSVTTSALST